MKIKSSSYLLIRPLLHPHLTFHDAQSQIYFFDFLDGITSEKMKLTDFLLILITRFVSDVAGMH